MELKLRPYERLALVERDVAQVFGADVLEQGADEHVVLVLLENLGAPAR